MPVGEELVDGSRRFGTKLWNATRFALGNGATVGTRVPDRAELTDADRWILDSADTLVSEVDAYYADFEFAKLSEALYHFTWDDFCDWYLELAKVQLAADGARADTTRAVLGRVLDVVLRLLHPVMPFITERLWTTLTGGEPLVIAAWPTATGEPADAESATRIEALQKLVTEIRRFRAEQGLPPGRKVPAELSGAGPLPHEPAIRALSRLDDVGAGFAATASLEVALPTGKVTVRLDLSGVIDVDAERKRLAKELDATEKELAQCAAKLDNPKFLDRAPADVVAKITTRRDAATDEIQRLRTQLAALRPNEGGR
jgi:valyl-tRNA synthetase